MEAVAGDSKPCGTIALMKTETLGGLPLKNSYDGGEVDLDKQTQPGEYPYARGIHADMYRGRLFTMRQFAGFGSAEETNERFKSLLTQGQTGLSVAFDMPTLYGYDTDAPEALGEFGKCGVAISSLADMERLFEGIDLGEVSVSMTINSPAAIIWAMYLAVAEKQRVPWEKLRGTLQNDILKEYIAQKEYIFPPKPSMRLVADTIAFAVEKTPKFNPISVSGYHIREAGATALQELSFTLADGLAYLDEMIGRGFAVDDVAPALSFFFDVHNDFFEEIAKLRAARVVWARILSEKYGAKSERSLKLRMHCQTAGVSLTAQQPENNIVRVSLQALAAVLGGTQSLHTNSMDEALALPSEEAVRIALRTQQIIAHESGTTNVADPLGGSFLVESLTQQMVDGAMEYIERLADVGGMLAAIELGYPQRQIADSASHFQLQVEERERTIVGVNDFLEGNEELAIPILKMDPGGFERQVNRLSKVKVDRDDAVVKASLQALREACLGKGNVMPPLLDCVRAYATLQEMMDVMRAVYGLYEEPSFF